jgi:hypothetical protein
VYVGTRGDFGGIEKFNSKGETQPFSCTAAECDYVGEGESEGKKNGVRNKITGTPGEPTTNPEGYEGETVAVDPSGDIYEAGFHSKLVREYAPSGKYLKTISLESPELPKGWDQGGVGSICGIAFDPVSGHLLVSLDSGGRGEPEYEVGAIDEFEAETGKYVAQLTRTSEGAPLHVPVAMAVDSLGDLYAIDEGAHAVDVWGPGKYYPTVTLAPATARTPTSAVLNGSVNPAQHGNTPPAPVTECYFQYVGEAAYLQALAKKEDGGFAAATTATCEHPDAAEILPLEPEASHPVHAAVGALKSGETYRYRLVAATEAANKGGTADSEVFAFTAPHAPRIESASVQNVSSTFADLHAQIDPLGATTTYHFEYLTAAAFAADGESFSGADPATSIPVPDEPLGSGGPTGSALESVEQHVGGLAPRTTYHFRAVAVNEIGSAEETEHSKGTFTTLPTALSGPPDNRAYELVTPDDKPGGSDLFGLSEANGEAQNRDVGSPAESGEAFSLKTLSPIGAFPFAASDQDVFARNVPAGGWGITSLVLPSLGLQNAQQPAIFDPGDLSRVAFTDGVGSATGEEGERFVDLVGPVGAQEVCKGAVSLQQAVSTDCEIALHEDPPVHYGAELHGTIVEGASHDLEHVVLESEQTSLCPGGQGVTDGHLLCEWDGGYETLADGEQQAELKLVNVKPGTEGQPVSQCGARLAGQDMIPYSNEGDTHDAVSADGQRVLIEAPDPEPPVEGGQGCWNRRAEEVEHKPPVNAPQLYQRVDGTSTLELSAPAEGVSVPADERYPTIFVGASETGTRVFFATETWLTANHPLAHDLELYEWEAEGAGDCTEESVDYVAASSGCLTRVSAGEHSELAAEVHMVLGVAADGSAVYFSANGVLAPGPAKPGNCQPARVPASQECPLYVYRVATATAPADLAYVATVSSSSFEQNEQNENIKHNVTGQGDTVNPENFTTHAYVTPDGRFLLFDNTGGIYRYDADTAALTHIAPSGLFTRSGNYTEPAGPVRAMSDNGQYAFFDTTEPLVSAASNGNLDVYEWHDGAISLIGSGTDPAPTFFLGYAPNPAAQSEEAREAGNVFIGTHAQLSPQDTNSVGDIYDARACEPESPCIKPERRGTAQCEGGTCQTPPPAPPDPTQTLLAPPAPATLAPPPPVKKKTAAELKAEQLAKALKSCKKDKNKKKRATCEKQAKQQYGATKAKKKAKKSNHGRAKS